MPALLRWLPAPIAVLFTVAVAVHFEMVGRAIYEEPPEPAEPSTQVVRVLALLFFTTPVGAGLGFAVRGLVKRYGAGGAVVSTLAFVLAGAVWVGVAILLVDNPIDPRDIGFLLSGWLWDRARWAGSILYLVTVPLDLMIMLFAVVFDRLAMMGVPPLGFVCSAVFSLLVGWPVLHRFRRR